MLSFRIKAFYSELQYLENADLIHFYLITFKCGKIIDTNLKRYDDIVPLTNVLEVGIIPFYKGTFLKFRKNEESWACEYYHLFTLHTE